MKTKKRRFEQFLFYDYTRIEAHLEKMSRKGWQIHKINQFYWEYRRIDPQQLTYTVTYFSEASDFNPYPTDNQYTFHEYCRDAGWELVAEWAQMQIFCTASENPAAIETEESIKLKAIQKAMKKNFLPSNALILLLSLFQIFFQLNTIKDDPIYHLSMGTTLFLTAIWSILFVQMLISLLGYAVWYRRSRKAVDTGGTCLASKSNRNVANFFKLLNGIVITLFVIFMSTLRFKWLGILVIINMTIIFTLVFTIRKMLKRAEVSRKVNLTVTLVSCVILSFAMTGVMAMGIVRMYHTGGFDNKPKEAYTATASNGTTYTWDVYHDPLPLKVEDLQDVDYDHYSYEWTVRESFLLSHSIARQYSFPDGQLAPELTYVIVKVKLPALFDLCMNSFLDQYNYEWMEPEEAKRYFRQTNDPVWQADEAYQLYQQDEPLDEYILCWGNRIVFINFDEIPTAEQIAIAVSKLSSIE